MFCLMAKIPSPVLALDFIAITPGTFASTASVAEFCVSSAGGYENPASHSQLIQETSITETNGRSGSDFGEKIGQSQFSSNGFHSVLVGSAYAIGSVPYSLVKRLQWDKPTHESAEVRS